MELCSPSAYLNEIKQPERVESRYCHVYRPSIARVVRVERNASVLVPSFILGSVALKLRTSNIGACDLTYRSWRNRVRGLFTRRRKTCTAADVCARVQVIRVPKRTPYIIHMGSVRTCPAWDSCFCIVIIILTSCDNANLSGKNHMFTDDAALIALHGLVTCGLFWEGGAVSM